MIIRPIASEDRAVYNSVAQHPLQSWEWGEFRRATGLEVERLGMFGNDGRLTGVVQATFHKIPVLGGTAGYIPKGPQPTADMFPALRALGQRHNAVFIKLEPSVQFPAGENSYFRDVDALLRKEGAVPGQALFTPYSFVLDLRPDEETLFENCKSKTRYNIRLAKKKGVTVVEDTSEQGLEDYLKLLAETTERQNFYAHDEQYFRTMWKVFQGNRSFRILKAMYQGQVQTVWILFLFNGVGYYPYGASTRANRELMASNLMMWEALMLAKREGCTSFDMWGSLGPDPDPKHKWYGFHRFKEGYGAKLMQSIGTYDFVLNGPMYKLFTIGNNLRWAWLRLRAR